jgi:hypothetical protein
MTWSLSVAKPTHIISDGSKVKVVMIHIDWLRLFVLVPPSGINSTALALGQISHAARE